MPGIDTSGIDSPSPGPRNRKSPGAHEHILNLTLASFEAAEKEPNSDPIDDVMHEDIVGDMLESPQWTHGKAGILNPGRPLYATLTRDESAFWVGQEYRINEQQAFDIFYAFLAMRTLYYDQHPELARPDVPVAPAALVAQAGHNPSSTRPTLGKRRGTSFHSLMVAAAEDQGHSLGGDSAAAMAKALADVKAVVTPADVRRVAAFICEPDAVESQVDRFMAHFDPDGNDMVTLKDFLGILNDHCASRRLRTLERFFFLFDEPTSSRASFLTAMTVMLLIVLSSLGFVLATEPVFQVPASKDEDPPEPHAFFFVLEALCIVLFTGEYLARACTVWAVRNELRENVISIPVLDAFLPHPRDPDGNDGAAAAAAAKTAGSAGAGAGAEDEGGAPGGGLLGLRRMRSKRRGLKRGSSNNVSSRALRTDLTSPRSALVAGGSHGAAAAAEGVALGAAGSANGPGMSGGSAKQQEQALAAAEDRATGPLTRTWRYLTAPLNLVDLVAIVPFYVGLLMRGGGSGLAVLRILRLARIFRVFKVGKYNDGVVMLSNTMNKSAPALQLMGFFAAIGLILFGSLIFYVERGTWQPPYRCAQKLNGSECAKGAFLRPDVVGTGWEPTPFTTIPRTFWFVLVTSTSVGYGDMYPTSHLGKGLSTVLSFLSILLLALPITIIGTNFSAEYDAVMSRKDREAREGKKETRRLAEAQNAAGLRRRVSLENTKGGGGAGTAPSSSSDSSSSSSSSSFQMNESDADGYSSASSLVARALRQEAGGAYDAAVRQQHRARRLVAAAERRARRAHSDRPAVSPPSSPQGDGGRGRGDGWSEPVAVEGFSRRMFQKIKAMARAASSKAGVTKFDHEPCFLFNAWASVRTLGGVDLIGEAGTGPDKNRGGTPSQHKTPPPNSPTGGGGGGDDAFFVRRGTTLETYHNTGGGGGLQFTPVLSESELEPLAETLDAAQTLLDFVLTLQSMEKLTEGSAHVLARTVQTLLRKLAMTAVALTAATPAAAAAATTTGAKGEGRRRRRQQPRQPRQQQEERRRQVEDDHNLDEHEAHEVASAADTLGGLVDNTIATMLVWVRRSSRIGQHSESGNSGDIALTSPDEERLLRHFTMAFAHAATKAQAALLRNQDSRGLARLCESPVDD